MLASFERSLIYPAPSVSHGNWETRWLDKEDVFFESHLQLGKKSLIKKLGKTGARTDSARLHGWFTPHPKPKQVVLYAHGQSEHVASLVSVVSRLQETLDASVFVFDYRGYGKSEGTPSEAGCIADGLAAQQWLAERTGKLPEEIVVMGRSLGGAIATAVAAERGTRALILENTFSRLTDIAAYRYPWIPIRRLMRDRYDSVARIANYRGPLLQLHGTRDRVAPAKFARELYAACPSDFKRFYTVRGGRHHDPAPLAFYTRLNHFLSEVTAMNQLRPLGLLELDSKASPELSTIG